MMTYDIIKTSMTFKYTDIIWIRKKTTQVKVYYG